MSKNRLKTLEKLKDQALGAIGKQQEQTAKRKADLEAEKEKNILERMKEGPKDYSDIDRPEFTRITLFVRTKEAELLDALAWKTGKAKNELGRRALMTLYGGEMNQQRLMEEWRESPDYIKRMERKRIRKNLLKSSDKDKLEFFWYMNFDKDQQYFKQITFTHDYGVYEDTQTGAQKTMLQIYDLTNNGQLYGSYIIQDETKVYCFQTDKRHRFGIK